MKLLKFVLMSCLNLKRVSEFNKKEMFEMLSLTLKESIILFDNKYYSQIDGVARGSPLRPTLANIFLCYHKSNCWKIA